MQLPIDCLLMKDKDGNFVDSTFKLTNSIVNWLANISRFSELVVGLSLREYQRRPANAILHSILKGKGLTFAVMMSRQAGKNELSAQLEAYLLNMYSVKGGTIVKASPTFKPQTVNSILRLCDRLDNVWNLGRYRRREGYIVEYFNARAYFFSAEPTANVVGATADILLEADEAQDIEQRKWDKDFTPMGASQNVTTVFYGTAWTENTFLAGMMCHLEELEAQDGVQRVFRVPCDEVAAEVPAYGRHVQQQIRRLGRNHPLIRTQYFLETIHNEGGLFPPQRQRLMHGGHPRRFFPQPGHRYAVLIDVAGEDEAVGGMLDRMFLLNPKRDATAITVVDVVIDRAVKPHQQLYFVQDRQLHLGTKFSALQGTILRQAQFWNAQWVIIDATGVGAGLASFLAKALGQKLIPIIFTPAIKSRLGWDFLAIIETGRYQDYAADGEDDTAQFWYEVGACQYEIREGPQKSMRWGVWEEPGYDGIVARGHDDLLISAAMCAFLEERTPTGDAVGSSVKTPDVLEGIDHAGWT